MGIFFFTQAAPLLDEFELKKEDIDPNTFKTDLSNQFNQRAYNCWIAAFLYVGLLVFAGTQFMTNQKQFTGSSGFNPMASSFAGITTEENGFNRQYGMQFNADQNN